MVLDPAIHTLSVTPSIPLQEVDIESFCKSSMQSVHLMAQIRKQKLQMRQKPIYPPGALYTGMQGYIGSLTILEETSLKELKDFLSEDGLTMSALIKERVVRLGENEDCFLL